MTTIVNNGKYTVRVAVPGVQGSPYESAEAQAATEAARDEALGYKNQAEAFATSASSSESGALASENKAKQWAEHPEDSEVEAGAFSALHYSKKALGAKVLSETAQGLAENAQSEAQASALAASESEANASTLAGNASASAGNASASETNAAASESNALASENKAQKWAEETEDVEVETGKYSALHWAAKASANVHTHGNKAILDAIEQAFTTALKDKLDGIANSANNYTHPSTHSLDIITETSTKKIMTADERDRLATIGGIPI